MHIQEMGNTKFTSTVNEDGSIAYELRGKDGTGNMISYPIFPGIYLMYSDFSMNECRAIGKSCEKMLSIDYCQRGRLEWDLEDHTHLYIGQEDVLINTRLYNPDKYVLPLGDYQGITIVLLMEEMDAELSSLLETFSIDVGAIHNKFKNVSSPTLLRPIKSATTILAELYNAVKPVDTSYCKIKILEMLFFLTSLDIDKNSKRYLSFSSKQVEKIKEIHAFLIDHPGNHYTIEQLSEDFNISRTSLKNCFKGVYGTSLYSYMRSYRIQYAARLLSETDNSIITIAGMVGYDNPSKFAAAFKEKFGSSPSEYRKVILENYAE